jgi:hypothetical protein
MYTHAGPASTGAEASLSSIVHMWFTQLGGYRGGQLQLPPRSMDASAVA